MAPDDLDTHLRSLGLDVELISDPKNNTYTAARNVTIPTGSLAGRVCDVALQRLPAVPYQVPAAIHIRPILVPMGTVGTQASDLGSDWQYWSRRLDRPPTPQVVWAHVLTVLGEV